MNRSLAAIVLLFFNTIAVPQESKSNLAERIAQEKDRRGIIEPLTDLDRFELWNMCRPLNMIVTLGGEITSLQLKQVDIERHVRSRLRAARIYGENAESQLFLGVHVIGNAYGLRTHFYKRVTDNVSRVEYFAPTWQNSGMGTHGNRGGSIMDSVSIHMDTFIDEYLRVNGVVCQ